MALLYRAFLLQVLLTLLCASTTADDTITFPCDAKLSAFLSESEHTITSEFDAVDAYWFATGHSQDDAIPVDSGTFMTLDDQFCIISIRFSEEYAFDETYTHLPEKLVITNDALHSDGFYFESIFDSNSIRSREKPWFCTMINPDPDDPYAFHHAGTWYKDFGYTYELTGYYLNDEGEYEQCFQSMFSPPSGLESMASTKSTITFPCDRELSPFLAESQHIISTQFDAVQAERMASFNWESDVTAIESGTTMILDDQFLIIDIQFSKEFFKEDDSDLPDMIIFSNINDEGMYVRPAPRKPWYYTAIYPDPNDPYAFHYAGTCVPAILGSDELAYYVLNDEGEYIWDGNLDWFIPLSPGGW